MGKSKLRMRNATNRRESEKGESTADEKRIFSVRERNVRNFGTRVLETMLRNGRGEVANSRGEGRELAEY